MDNTNELFARGMRAVALGTFLIGTLIFITYYFIGGKILLVGYAYIVIAFFVNIPMFMVGIGEARATKDKKLLRSAACMLLNIPVMTIYAWIALTIINGS
jgi:hypothetical protein